MHIADKLKFVAIVLESASVHLHSKGAAMAIHIACDYFRMATFRYKNTRLRRYLWNFLRAIFQRLCFMCVLLSGIGNFYILLRLQRVQRRGFPKPLRWG